jgi:hypothetical protein
MDLDMDLYTLKTQRLFEDTQAIRKIPHSIQKIPIPRCTFSMQASTVQNLYENSERR